MAETSGGGRTLAIGDVHGCLTALETLLARIAPCAGDALVLLGDYVDRGPDPRGVLDTVLELERCHEVIALLGNHEQMMLEACATPDVLAGWLAYGGDTTLASYGIEPNAFCPESLPAEHWEFLTTRCRDGYESETHLFVHAGLKPKLPLNRQPVSVLRWDKLADHGPHISGKTVVCGHTRQISGWPLDLGHTICIDTWVYGDGWLTCLEPSTYRIWQANQRGEWREGLLRE